MRLASLIRYVHRLTEILGIVLDYHIPSRTKANFDFIFKSIQEMLNMWKWRGLTLIGKIEIVKSLIIPKFLSKAALISVTDDLVQEINKLVYRFIWMGTDKIKRCALIDHFTVVCLVAWPLNESEAGVDLVLIETLLLFICKFLLISMRTASLT